ncbi:MAG: HD-GYP domain-containing protein [Clostridiaceae bacterium]|nr:HD-GYP domain-containing protein [Clostridiaceae bacterium]
MLSEKKSLPINELQVGMISASNIFFEDKVLLSDGFAITDSILYKLKRIYIIDKVEVYSDTDPTEVLRIKSKTVNEIESTFNDFSGNLATIFNTMSILRVPAIEEVRTFSRRIQEEFHSVGSVIRNIIFYGSGNDQIYRHTINVTAISYILGKWIGLDSKELNLLTYSAILHDFGKVKLNKSILYKKGKLTTNEVEIYKTHPLLGYNFVKQIPYLDPSVSQSVLMHHERMDGSGYPLHVKGDKIPRFAKIIAIADLFDQVNSNRYSKNINGPFEALKAIQDEGYLKLDNEYCNTFLKGIVNYYMGENVLLSNNQSYKVIKIHLNDIAKPLLIDSKGFLDFTKEKDLYIKKLII